MIPRIIHSVASRTDAVVNWTLPTILRWSHSALAPTLSIPSHITPRERLQLHKLAAGKAVIVEIGSYVGASAAAFASARRPRGSRIYCIDTWQNHAMSEGQRSTEQEFQNNLGSSLPEVKMMKGYSHDQFAVVQEMEKHIDLLFIDGDHSYEGALLDWTLYSKLLRPGSVVAFHDYGWASGVQQVVREATKSCLVPTGVLPNLWWGACKCARGGSDVVCE